RLPTPCLALVLLAAPLLAGCDVRVGDNGLDFDIAANSARDEWRRTYTLPEGARFEIANGNGGIEVTQGSGREVEVVALRQVRGDSEEEARAFLAALEMEEQVASDRVRLEAQVPNQQNSRRNVTIRYTVRVPSGLNLSFVTGNGGVDVENVTGNVVAETTNGGITAEDITGSFKATAVNGGIRVEMASVTGDLEMSVTNGGVRLELPSATKATLDASCVNGGIDVDDELGLQAGENTRRRVTGTLNGGGPRITASTVNGGIEIDARIDDPS
ncbi:MAG: DUF4097 domain-containing protein, partial [Vicinamibacterales bacterium]